MSTPLVESCTKLIALPVWSVTAVTVQGVQPLAVAPTSTAIEVVAALVALKKSFSVAVKVSARVSTSTVTS